MCPCDAAGDAMKPVNARSFVSLSLLAGFLVLAATGVLLFFFKHATATAAIHTTFGALLLVAAALHIRNNFKPIKNYSYGPGERGVFPRRRELWLPLAVSGALVGGLVVEAPGLTFLYTWGSELRTRQENKQESRVTIQAIETNAGGRGVELELDVRKGKAFGYPLFALWTEDLDGRYLQTLYVSRAIGTSRFTYGRELDGGEWVPDVVRRPEALPYWGHKRGVEARDGFYLPDPDSPVPDAVSAATPTEGFRLRTRTDVPTPPFRLLLEVNQSYDWNDYFSKDRFPDDPIYSGSGQNGQPSVVYAATIDPALGARHYAMNPIGHGHPGGADGELREDLSLLTTALAIIDGALVKVLR
jgi:hypothetical protein